MKVTALLESLGITQEALDKAIAECKPASAKIVAKTVIKAWNMGEKTIPIYIGVLLATEVLENKQINGTYNRRMKWLNTGKNQSLLKRWS